MKLVEMSFMTQFETEIAKKVAQAAVTCHLDRTGLGARFGGGGFEWGHAGGDAAWGIVPAERTMAKTEAGAAKVQEFHSQLFSSSLDPFARQVKEILGADLLDAKAVADPGTGTVMQVFTKGNGTMVQMFLLNGKVDAGAWSGAADRN